MNTERDKKTPPTPTGRRYDSVDEMLSSESFSPTVREAITELDKEVTLVQNLVQMRQSAGLTQQSLADSLGKTQGAISKLENSKDNEITIGELCSYSQAANQQFMIWIGKPMNHVEAVKWHACGIREHLSALAKMAHQDGDMEQAIQAFFGEAFFNILTILGKCQEEMPPNKEVQVRFKRVGHIQPAQRMAKFSEKQTA